MGLGRGRWEGGVDGFPGGRVHSTLLLADSLKAEKTAVLCSGTCPQSGPEGF